MSAYQLPVITLDTTLLDLYKKSLHGTGTTVLLVASFPDGLHLENQRYVFHDEQIVNRSNDTPAQAEQRETRYVLEAVMQRAIATQNLTFCAGKGITVAFSALYPSEAGAIPEPMFKVAARENLKVLQPWQQTYISFMTEVDLPSMAEVINNNNLLACHIPVDDTPGYRCVIEPDDHYRLLSKSGLAESGLQTPRCDIIELGTDAEIQERKSNSDDISQDQSNLLDAAIITRFRDDVMRAVRNRNSRFVMKLQHTIAGFGTFIIQSMKDQDDLISRLPLILDYILGQTNVDNLGLRSSSIILSDFIASSQDPPISYAISMFVHPNQEPDFICCVQQNMDTNNIWQGASIDYSRQGHYQTLFRDRINETSLFLQGKKYFGPVGIDVLIDANNKQWIVDLNVRTPGSLVLGLLQTCLWQNGQPGGFRYAKLVSLLRTNKTKAQFLEAFQLPIAHGSMIIIAWWSDNEDGQGKNYASLVLAASQAGGIPYLEEHLRNHG